MPQDPLPDWLRDWRWEIGRRIRAEREWANITQEALAHRIGIERPNLVRFERGHSSPPVDRLLHIARALGVEPARLMPGGPERQPAAVPDAHTSE